MQTLSSDTGTYREDFFYGYPYDTVLPPNPPQFDYSGAALTNTGWVLCTPAEFSLQYGSGADNSDTLAAYGGAPSSNSYYLRFPVVEWDAQVGLFLEVTTTEQAELSFDRSFSGYVGDRFIVTVNDVERISISNTAGHPWTRSTITLPKGTSRIAILLVTAPYYSSGVVREGIAQQNSAVTSLARYLRLSNLAITNVAEIPTAGDQALQMIADTTFALTPSLEVTSGALLWVATAGLTALSKMPTPSRWAPDTTFTMATPEVGSEVAFRLASTAAMTLNGLVERHSASDNGGFVVSSSASLSVETTTPQDITDLIRPMKRTSLRMTRPMMVGGRPETPKAIGETEFTTVVDGGLVLDRINPFTPSNAIPATVGGLTYRWSSLDAQAPFGDLTSWATMDHAGPTWTTPGAFRPQVANYVRHHGTTASELRYPAVIFDSANFDHLLMTLPSAPAGGKMTWAFIGSFTRYRGNFRDSLPILDYAGNAPINYSPANEPHATRANFEGWLSPGAHTYLGLTSYGTADPTTSRLAYSEGSVYNRSDRLILRDNLPYVLIVSMDGPNTFVLLLPLTPSGSQGRQLIPIPRPADTSGGKAFALGKARAMVPFGGSFVTGSMSLLEVSYANRALTMAQADALGEFYARLYAPLTNAQIPPDLTVDAAVKNPNIEQILIYARNPETPLALITGDRAVPMGVYISDPDGLALSQVMGTSGVPLVAVSNEVYASMVAILEAE